MTFFWNILYLCTFNEVITKLIDLKRIPAPVGSATSMFCLHSVPNRGLRS
jgi:hypothetical protein